VSQFFTRTGHDFDWRRTVKYVPGRLQSAGQRRRNNQLNAKIKGGRARMFGLDHAFCGQWRVEYHRVGRIAAVDRIEFGLAVAD